MSISILRTDGAWWAVAHNGEASMIETSAATTRELLADRAAIEAAVGSTQTVPVDTLSLLSPVTAPCRVIAQMLNYVSHAIDAGVNPKTMQLGFFRKASSSISGPVDDIIKPAHVQFLDYEVEIGIVFGKAIPIGSVITEENLAEHVAGLVVTNDVTAREIQLIKTQFYESKSYPTFTPVGPALVLLDADELKRFVDLRVRLWVNGELRQNQTVADMAFGPVEALQALTRFQAIEPGDLMLTGTPVGTAISAPNKAVQFVGSLLPPAIKWKAFFKTQANNEKYLHDGDVVEVTVASDDGVIELGRQRTTVRYAK